VVDFISLKHHLDYREESKMAEQKKLDKGAKYADFDVDGD